MKELLYLKVNSKSWRKGRRFILKSRTFIKEILGDDEDELLPAEGVNIRLFFPSNSSENALITRMAKELDVDFSIVWGKLEKFRESVLGSLVINIDAKDKNNIEYLEKKNIILEVIS